MGIRDAEILARAVLQVIVADQRIDDGRILHRRASESQIHPRREDHARDRRGAMGLLGQLRQRHQRQTAARRVADNHDSVKA